MGRTLTFRDLDAQRPAGGQTPNELAKLLRVSPDRVRCWIKAGAMGAVNTAPTLSGKPRYIILPHHLAEFERARRAGPPPKPARRRRQPAMVDYFPD
jgi:hypothetical protein